MAQRKALYSLGRTGPRKPPERKIQTVCRTQTQPNGANLLCDGPEFGAQQKYRAGWILSTNVRAPGRLTGQCRIGTKIGRVVLAADGQRRGLCGARVGQVRRAGVRNQASDLSSPRS